MYSDVPNAAGEFGMTTIAVSVDDEIAKRLKAEATRQSITVEELLSRQARQLVMSHEEKVRAIGRRIIDEESELLRRLA